MEIGGVIKELRTRAGFKQKEFAKECSISPSFLSQIETDQRYPHPNTLKVISEVLKVPQAVIHMLSLDDEVIPREKRDAFNILFPPFKAFITELFLKEKN